MEAETLLDLASDRRVRQSKGFREVAEGLDGELLKALYGRQRERAPRRAAAGKRFFPKHSARVGKKPVEHACRALLRWAAEAEDATLEYDEENALRPIDWGVPLASAPVEKDDPRDPNRGVGKIDVLGAAGGERLAVAALKYLDADATRGTTGDTPLRALLETLAASAIVGANLEDIRKEAGEKFGAAFASLAPAVLIIGTPRYWELCRRREAQKGARWIKELERIAREVEEHLAIPVRFLALRLEGGLTSDDDGPRLEAAPSLGPAWEARAGVVKPKPPPKPKAASPADEVVEADLDRPVRGYATTEVFEPGDRLQHPTLGLGVVQAVAGPAKVRVRFDGTDRVLVHNRATS